MEKNPESTDEILVVFSDVDGTLVHYPDHIPDNDALLRLPPSTTGMRGVISPRTLQLCQTLRRTTNAKLVIISGMRTHTLLKRMPFLPKADAYCSEAGGRIFYPTSTTSDKNVFVPESHTGALEPVDLASFGLVEDMEWRVQMQQVSAAGPDGFVGNEIASFFEENNAAASTVVAVEERTGELWAFARHLTSLGLALDTKGYSSCFRVNRKHQATDLQQERFDELVKGSVPHPPSLATSTNLGSIDYYPVDSGKKNCCQYLLNKFSSDGNNKKTTLERNALCLCDDDNDLEMAMACKHAYLPAISSQSMADIVKEHTDHFTLAENKDKGVVETLATEEALTLVVRRVAAAQLRP